MSDSARLSFDFGDAWRIQPVANLPGFIDAVHAIMPANSIAFLEGTTTPPDVADALRRIEMATTLRIVGGTIWPKPGSFHVPYTTANAQILKSIFDRDDPHDICHHFHVYAGRTMLLYWHDVFDGDPFYLAGHFDEAVVEAFCREIESKYEKLRA